MMIIGDDDGASCDLPNSFFPPRPVEEDGRAAHGHAHDDRPEDVLEACNKVVWKYLG